MCTAAPSLPIQSAALARQSAVNGSLSDRCTVIGPAAEAIDAKSRSMFTPRCEGGIGDQVVHREPACHRDQAGEASMRPVPAEVGEQRPAADAVSDEDGLGNL